MMGSSSIQQIINRTALVCGASQGIGLESAKALASRGCRVVLLARREEVLHRVAKTLPNPELAHTILAVDLADGNLLNERLSPVLARTGPISILVNNAGGPQAGPLIAATGEEFLMAFKTHILAAQTLLQSLLPGMKESQYGRIINIISTSVKVPLANLGVSNTIRGAMANWSKTLALELGPYGITVNNLLPGYTETERLKALMETSASGSGQTLNEIKDNWQKSVPLKRFAQVWEIAEAVAFLASPAASYVNGINFPVDGGRTGAL